MQKSDPRGDDPPAGGGKGQKKMPEKGTEKVPGKGSEEVPPKGTARSAGNPAGTGQQKEIERIPEKGTIKMPAKGTEKIPEKDTGKSPEKDAGKSPEKETEKIPGRDTGKVPEKGAGEIPPKETEKIPGKDTGKVPEKEPAATGTEFQPLEIKTHREMAVGQEEIFRRFNARPDLSILLLLNPVLALEQIGVLLSSEMVHHVLHSRQHTPEMRKRREELEASLTKNLGEAPQPDNPAWVARLLFEKLRIKPLETKGHTPAYIDPTPADALKRLQALRPKARKKYPERKHPRPATKVGLNPWKTAIRRIDLEAPLPKLQPARQAPKELPLEELYFYRDSHPLVHDLLELGVIQRRAVRIHSGASFRDILSGKKPNAFHTWFKVIRFPERQKR